ncbi:sugar transferase [Pontibacter ramchanderi]|uniref:Lipopolysaccharide/colanic/teichoic acid biosynthesis glycosyltransferase n=1 Tax=Pontibacter ramchanderi TaxID=1179743 RepID=A0A2N3U7R7_9BACT|nr:sugar transferase [Pontibacter ramchanderi]PKV62792.1 lipopolysaccharide/colanic/teichoic acid biosynthesis glycosyltransferase [Pontibacter ramchanderi]
MNLQLLYFNGLDLNKTKLNVIKHEKVSEKKCLIINPGAIALELIQEPKFKKVYTVDFWENSSEVDLATFLSQKHFDVVLLDPSYNITLNNSQLKQINNLRVKQVCVYNLASFYESFTERIPSVHCKSWLISSDLFYVNSRTNFFQLKRAIDLTVAFSFAPIAFLLVLMAIVCIKATSKGPAFFIQNRVGLKGKVFSIYKLRTMYYSPESTNNSHTVLNDSRITPIGKFLRKTKIDELPQLINIICGHMSLIGPRPEKEDIVCKLAEEAPYYNLRHAIRPGVTGLAQVTYPTATPEQNLQKLEYDLFYLKNASLLLDIKILFKTIKVVLTMNSL